MAENFDYKEAPDLAMLGEGPDPEPPRRTFLFWFGAGLNVIVGTLIALPILGYLFNTWKGTGWQKWTDIGKVDKYPKGETRLATYTNPFRTPWDGYVADTPCWVRRKEDGDFTVFAINCAHLGCPVRWFPESQLFMCPCHGGVYYADGSHAAGPPPRGLYVYESKIVGDQLQIKAGRLPTLQQSP